MCELMVYHPSSKSWVLNRGRKLKANRLYVIVHEDAQSSNKSCPNSDSLQVEAWLSSPYFFGKHTVGSCESCQEIMDEVFDILGNERGWDVAKGIPTMEKLTELGLDKFAEVLKLS